MVQYCLAELLTLVAVQTVRQHASAARALLQIGRPAVSKP